MAGNGLQNGQPGLWTFMRWASIVALVVSLIVLLSLARVFVHTPSELAPPTTFLVGVVTLFLVSALAMSIYALWKTRGAFWTAQSVTRQRDDIIVAGDFESVLAACEKAVMRLGGRSIKLDARRGLMRAKTGLSLSSLGEKLTLHVEPVDRHRCHVSVESDSLLPTTLFDFGANRRNVRFIVQVLSGPSGKSGVGVYCRYT